MFSSLYFFCFSQGTPKKIKFYLGFVPWCFKEWLVIFLLKFQDFSPNLFTLFVSGGEIVVFGSSLALWFTNLCSFNSKLQNSRLTVAFVLEFLSSRY